MESLNIIFSTQAIRSLKDRNILRVYFDEGKKSELFKNSRGITELHIGISKRKEVGRRELVILARRVIHSAKKQGAKKLAISFEDFLFPQLKDVSDCDIATLMAENFLMANFEFSKFKTSSKERDRFVGSVIVCNVSKDAKKGFLKGQGPEYTGKVIVVDIGIPAQLT